MIKLSAKVYALLMRLKPLCCDEDILARFKLYWDDLRKNDAVLLQFIKGEIPQSGNIILANMLFVLNHEIDHELYLLLKSLGLPPSQLDDLDMKFLLRTVTDQPGHIEIDGILSQNSPYAGLDPKWIELFLSYVAFHAFPDEISAFGTTPALLKFESQQPLTIAVMGDWGTGRYNDYGNPSPSSLVGQGIRSLKPDITIHLGDVYYAGTADQMSNKLLLDFPTGKLANFTLTGNHEMFDGANGYFDTALAHKIFEGQKSTSYFALRHGKYIIIGLDTAYYDSSLYYLSGALIDTHQMSFIESLNIQDDQKIILFTHHAGMKFNGTEINEPLFSQIYKALGSRHPDYWYYGHIHNGIVYNRQSAMGNYLCSSGQIPQLRCLGHASIPIGKAKGLHDEGGHKTPGIDYFAATPMPNPHNLSALTNRVLNGFGFLTIHNNEFHEQVFEAHTDEGPLPVWNKKHQLNYKHQSF